MDCEIIKMIFLRPKHGSWSIFQIHGSTLVHENLLNQVVKLQFFKIILYLEIKSRKKKKYEFMNQASLTKFLTTKEKFCKFLKCNLSYMKLISWHENRMNNA